MDINSDLSRRSKQGFQSFFDGEFDHCIEIFGPMLRYFATNQMLAAVLISLQRTGRNEELADFAGQCLRVMEDRPDTSLQFKVALGIEKPNPPLLSNMDASIAAILHYYIGAYHASVGELGSAVEHFEICAERAPPSFEAEAAASELRRAENSVLEEDEWVRRVQSSAQSLSSLVRAGTLEEANRAAGQSLHLLEQRPLASNPDLLSAFEVFFDYFARTGQWERACYVCDRLIENSPGCRKRVRTRTNTIQSRSHAPEPRKTGRG